MKVSCAGIELSVLSDHQHSLCFIEYVVWVHRDTCHCSRGRLNLGQEVDESQCDAPCQGDEDKTCGGQGNLFDLYSTEEED